MDAAQSAPNNPAELHEDSLFGVGASAVTDR
jgi:hypothetical protein